ncbi:MAG: deoxyribonuclease V [Chloroflexi bacterium]|nr:deoxyribonuclease V [Chloroflexota bacterium]
MELCRLHEWGLTYAEAIQVQLALAGMVSTRNEVVAPRLIAGIDARYEGSKGMATGAVVVLSYPDMALREVRTCQALPLFPYIPGLLSFRECPVIMEACRRLTLSPDLVFVDGQGIAHPRRIGLASHVGLLLDRPTIGCAKSRLCGEHEEPGPDRGAWSDLVDAGAVIGASLRTKSRTKPVYVSVGHRVDLSTAIQWALACYGGYRLPEPVRLAHLAASGKLAETEA